MMGVGTHKGANEITLQNDYESFVVFSIFSHERVFEWNLLQLIFKNTYSCPNKSPILC